MIWHFSVTSPTIYSNSWSVNHDHYYHPFIDHCHAVNAARSCYWGHIWELAVAQVSAILLFLHVSHRYIPEVGCFALGLWTTIQRRLLQSSLQCGRQYLIPMMKCELCCWFWAGCWCAALSQVFFSLADVPTIWLLHQHVQSWPKQHHSLDLWLTALHCLT
jgi:hypothetical protein